MGEKVTGKRALLDELATLAASERAVVLGGAGGAPPPGVLRPGRARLFAVSAGRRHILLDRGGAAVELALEPGTLCFVAPEGWHRSFDRAANTCFSVIWDPHSTSLTRKTHPAAGGRVDPSHWHSSRRIDATALHLIRALGDITAGRGDAVAAPALVRGLLLLTHAELQRDEGRRDPARATWQAVRDHVEAHFSEPINRDRVAAAFDLHPNHLSRLFRREGGEGFHAWLTRLRQGRAAALIDQGVVGNAELARRCGYESANYFAKAFRRFHGCSPGAYARLARRRSGD